MAERVRMFFGDLCTRNLNHLCKIVKNRESLRFCGTLSNVSSHGGEETEKDIETLFLDPRVQIGLKTITRCRMEKVFSPVKQKLSVPRYRFVTDEELKELMDKARRRAEQKLQMPPVMKPITFKPKIYSKDPELQGLNTCKHVFIDTTYGISERKRIIVTRHPDGTLCDSSLDERKRMNQIYLPFPGRSLRIPKMFGEQLENVLERRQYEFILDRACVQFDPDDPDYIRVTHKTYDHIEKTRSFDVLRSTRHFGPMAFYLILEKCCDMLLVDMIQRSYINDAAHVVKLYHIIHPESKSAQQHFADDDDIALVKAFAEMDSNKRSNLELVLQAYEEAEKDHRVEDVGQVQVQS